MADSEYSRVLAETLKEFPKFRVVSKADSKFMRFLAKLLFFNKAFMTSFHTTIGNKLYVARSWRDLSDYGKAALLRHERVHLRQQKRYTMALYSMMYLLLLPTVLTFRAMLEREAYEESMRAKMEYWGPDSFTEPAREAMVKHFISGEYFWMWPFKKRVERWYDRVVEELRKKA